MVAVGMSEFTFGFAFLYEQVRRNWEDVKAFPVLPSLQQEATVGWDSKLPLRGTDFYYQFKLSDHLTRPNARFIRNGDYNSPYFEIRLHKAQRNRQHRRLKEHSKTNPDTYYVAPQFQTMDQFNSSFLSQQIVANSRLFPLVDCDEINDGQQHYISFQNSGSVWRQHSESTRHERSISGKELDTIYSRSAQRWVDIDEGFAVNIFQRTSDAARKLITEEEKRQVQAIVPLLDFHASNHSRMEILERTSEILSVFFGVTLVIVGERT